MGADKGAFGDDLERLGLHRLQSATRKLRADAAAGERLWHFGMREGDHAGSETIVGECLVAVDVEFEAMVQRVLANVGQGMPRGLYGLKYQARLRAPMRIRLQCRSSSQVFHRQGYPMKTVAYLLGALLIVSAAIYLLVPADSLPSFFPGHEAGLARIRLKHGLVAAVAGIVLFAVGWFSGRRA